MYANDRSHLKAVSTARLVNPSGRVAMSSGISKRRINLSVLRSMIQREGG